MRSNGRCIGMALGVLAVCTVAMAVFSAPSGKPEKASEQEIYFDVEIMAGIQIALTQPASIGDSILFEGQWGWVEELTYTYITIRTWDDRRIVVPLSYFISHPFENWSMKSAHTIQPIYLYVDYTIDVQTVRSKFHDLVKECKDWDGPAESVLEVTGVKEDTMELRALCSAKDPPTAWRLHCRLREELIAFVRDLESGRFLPKHRVAWQPEGDRPAVAQQAPREEKSDAKAETW